MTAASGVDFVYENGASGAFLFPEIMGGGAAVLDFDNDRYHSLTPGQGVVIPRESES